MLGAPRREGEAVTARKRARDAWVIVGSTGEYSDRSEWCVRVFDTEAAAIDTCPVCAACFQANVDCGLCNAAAVIRELGNAEPKGEK
jgi:hypothetical protein